MELYHENEMWVFLSTNSKRFLIHQGIYKKFVMSTKVSCYLLLVYTKRMSHGCPHPKGLFIHQGLYRKSVMSTALLAVAGKFLGVLIQKESSSMKAYIRS
jgi:hypothetical protein